MTEIMRASYWANNSALIADVAQLGYIRDDDLVMDATYGKGNFWNDYRPPGGLIAHDLYTLDGVDFRHLPEQDETYDVVVFDPPYKLNGTSQIPSDAAYGVQRSASVAERHALILDGITECARVLQYNGRLLVKCQDQVSMGKMWWQTDLITHHAFGLDLFKRDRFDLLTTPRAQPYGTRQLHARANYSTLLVFVK